MSFDDADGVTGEDPLGLGLRFRLDRSLDPPRLLARFEPRPDHRGPPGHLHGGMAAAVLDETMASLSWALEGLPSMTARLELRYRKSVPLDGKPVRVEAWRAREGARRVQKVMGRIVLADESVAVEASGLFVEVRP
ncbi:MAG TPA: PaaI family thioesterase [Acidimicrobiales bacterium]|nr:PaaI family thioesterase [Acidimicrobiales bacterium]